MTKITLLDDSGCERTFDKNDLLAQLATQTSILGNNPATLAARNLTNEFKRLRDAQKEYFASRKNNDEEKTRTLLMIAKKTESSIDGMLSKMEYIIQATEKMNRT